MDTGISDCAEPFRANATFVGAIWQAGDIDREELIRARHALAYLKSKMGNDAMRSLLADDLAAMMAQAQEWQKTSAGKWQTAAVELVVPGPDAVTFHTWYARAFSKGREDVLRAGHPEHFVSHPQARGVEVIENIGETDLPWRVIYRGLPDSASFPTAWDPDFPVRFGAELLDGDGVAVGYTMHQARDLTDGMHLKLTTVLPTATPLSLVERHLRHLIIEFRNWTHIAWSEARASQGARS